MPPSSNDPEQAEQAEGTLPPASFTAAEIMAFQVVARRSRVDLFELIRLAEIREQYPDAPFSLPNDYMSRPASLDRLTVPTTAPSTENVGCGIAKGSMWHTFKEEEENEGYAAIKAEMFNFNVAGFAEEQHQANAPEGKHGSTVFQVRTKGLRCKPDPSSTHGKHPISTKS